MAVTAAGYPNPLKIGARYCKVVQTGATHCNAVEGRERANDEAALSYPKMSKNRAGAGATETL